jgi:hypothetical protein
VRSAYRGWTLLRPPDHNAGILGGSATSAQGKHHSNTNKGGGVSARPLPVPVNPALLRHADQITRFAGAMLLVSLHVLWFAAWILSGVHPGHRPAQTRTGQDSPRGARAKQRLLGGRSGHSVAGDCAADRRGRFVC